MYNIGYIIQIIDITWWVHPHTFCFELDYQKWSILVFGITDYCLWSILLIMNPKLVHKLKCKTYHFDGDNFRALATCQPSWQLCDVLVPLNLSIETGTGLVPAKAANIKFRKKYLKWIYFGRIYDVAVFKIRSETCRTEARFCENLYMIKKESLPNLAGPTQILPVNVRGPALILKTDVAFTKLS